MKLIHHLQISDCVSVSSSGGYVFYVFILSIQASFECGRSIKSSPEVRRRSVIYFESLHLGTSGDSTTNIETLKSEIHMHHESCIQGWTATVIDQTSK